MTDDQDTVEVVLEEVEKKAKDEPEIEVVDEKAPPEPPKAEITPDEGIQELKKKLDMAEQARKDAERRAHEAQAKAQRADGEVKDANYNMIVNAIETVKGRGAALKTAYAEAMNVGDFSKAAEIQEAMAMNANQLADLKKGEKAIKEQLDEPAVEPPKGNMVDQIISQVSPKSAAWLNSNRDLVHDDRSVRKMFRAHEDAIDEGIEPDTEDYFRFVEGRLGKAKPQESPLSEAAAPKKSTQPPPAPVSRAPSPRQGVVRLTREQADTARMLGMTEQEYAKNMLALQKEGKLGN
jgi:hypothetical protein